LGLAGLEHGINIVRRDARGRPQDQKMIEDVGAFRGQMRLVVADRGQSRLDGFFAEFLGAFLHALRQELGGIGLRRIAFLLSRHDGGEQAVQGMGLVHGGALAWPSRAGPALPAGKPGLNTRQSLVAQNAGMTRQASHPARLPALALAIAGGIALGYLVFLGQTLILHRWIWDAAGRPFATDFISFWSAGHLALQGNAAAAYDWPTMHRLQIAMMGHDPGGYFGWAYPPLFLCVALVLAAMPYVTSFLVWVGVSFALYAVAVARIAREPGAALLAGAMPAALACAMVGQNGFLSALLIAGVLLQLEKRPILAGLFLGLLTYKPHFGLLFPLALICGGYWRAFLSAAITSIIIVLFSWLVAPDSLAAFFAHMGGMSANFLSNGSEGFYKQQSLYGLLRVLGVADQPSFWAQGVLFLAMAGFVGVLWRGKSSSALKAASLVVAALLATPYLYFYDFPILSIAIAYLWRDQAFSRNEAALLLASQIVMAGFMVLNAPMGFFGALLVLAVVLGRVAAPAFKTALESRTA
jgi:arabinofuranan 3-O-arabinosyltransferase